MSEKRDDSRPVQEFPGQHDDETVDFVFRQHPVVMRKALLAGMVGIVLAILPWDFPQIYESSLAQTAASWFMWILLAAVAFMWFHRWVGWFYSVYIVTDMRVIEIKQHGFFQRSVNEWQLNNISNVNYEIGGFQAVLFNFGNITAQSYLGDFKIEKVHHPSDIHQQLLDAVRKGGGGASLPLSSTRASD